MLDTLISSKTRIKLLQKFFLNSNIQSYLRGLESEFGDSTNSIRLELNRLEQAGMIYSEMRGNKKVFRANNAHPLFLDIQNIVRKYIVRNVLIFQNFAYPFSKSCRLPYLYKHLIDKRL